MEKYLHGPGIPYGTCSKGFLFGLADAEKTREKEEMYGKWHDMHFKQRELFWCCKTENVFIFGLTFEIIILKENLFEKKPFRGGLLKEWFLFE